MKGAGEMFEVKALVAQGASVSAVARELGMDRKTVRKYIELGLEPPTYGARKPRPRRFEL